MKKYYLFIAAMLAVCICSALACSSVHKTETTPTAQPTAQPTEWQAGHQVPPDSIEFRSVEEMQAFFSSVKLDDSKVESYIEERGICWNALTGFPSRPTRSINRITWIITPHSGVLPLCTSLIKGTVTSRFLRGFPPIRKHCSTAKSSQRTLRK